MATCHKSIGERRGGVSRFRLFLSFPSFSLLSLDSSATKMAISLPVGGSPQPIGVYLGGSCWRSKTASPLPVALLEEGWRRDLSRGVSRRQRKTVNRKVKMSSYVLMFEYFNYVCLWLCSFIVNLKKFNVLICFDIFSVFVSCEWLRKRHDRG